MFCQVESPVRITPRALDQYLFRGWFRMGQNIFTTNFLNFKNQFYSAIWLRVGLERYAKDHTEVKLRKLNSKFSVRIQKASLTAVKEELFSRYRENISFEASSSLYQLMFGKATTDVYNTMEVTIHEGGKLIACGFFDLGEESAAGITSFYDPAYKKHSLGKYLIYLKINFCAENGLKYFYPGYFVPGYSFFDYKLSIGKKTLEYLDAVTGDWLPIENFSPMLSPIRIMQDKLNSIQIDLAQAKIICELYRYEFFEANLLPELKDALLFDYPLFLHSPRLDFDPYYSVIVYDIQEKLYHLIRCRSLWNSNLSNHSGMYSEQLLKEEIKVVSSGDAEDIIAGFIDEMKRGIIIY